ncbi:MAG: 1,6-anhydro-N-acetylmuramyl-L-alanine amidase AmpD [Sulfuricella sp.]|nr:1,6-anhydro-N-acetylmuramyl-L-alanine amidase AmpD [Sulfuricella sp.]
MKIDKSGFLQGARFISTPNGDERPPEVEFDIPLLVIHNISLPPREYGGNGVIDFFTNKLDINAHPYYPMIADLRVSAHFFIRRDGEIIQFVSCNKRAWHAGVSVWRDRTRCNDFSIGIELEGSDDDPFTDIQYDKLAELTRALQETYPIEEIVGHADIAPVRKTDPGPCFDWQRYRSLVAAESPE